MQNSKKTYRSPELQANATPLPVVQTALPSASGATAQGQLTALSGSQTSALPAGTSPAAVGVATAANLDQCIDIYPNFQVRG